MGGILIVPFLTILMGEPITLAIGTSLVAVVASSTGAAAHNVRTGRADVRLGLTLEVATAMGAAAGGSARRADRRGGPGGPFRGVDGLHRTVPAAQRALARARGARCDRGRPGGPRWRHAPAYRASGLPLALGVSASAGVASSLLGVGGGIIKVPLLRLVMGVPMHIAAATSNFMIGVTAAAGAYAYLFRGDIAP